jgi:hypothetical protein
MYLDDLRQTLDLAGEARRRGRSLQLERHLDRAPSGEVVVLAAVNTGHGEPGGGRTRED